MNEVVRDALRSWDQISRRGVREEMRPVDEALDSILHGDPALGHDVPFDLLVDRFGSALRPYAAADSSDANQRVIPQFIFSKWAKKMRGEGKPFMLRGQFPVLYLYVTPDDPNNFGAFEYKAIGEHNCYTHLDMSGLSLAPHCARFDACLGYGYTPFSPGMRSSIRPLMKALEVQDWLYPRRYAIGEETILIFGVAGDGKERALALRRKLNWELHEVDLRYPQPVPRDTSVPVTVRLGELGTLTHSQLWGNCDPTLIRTPEQWRESRTTTFTLAMGGEPERLIVANFEHYHLP